MNDAADIDTRRIEIDRIDLRVRFSALHRVARSALKAKRTRDKTSEREGGKNERGNRRSFIELLYHSSLFLFSSTSNHVYFFPSAGNITQYSCLVADLFIIASFSPSSPSLPFLPSAGNTLLLFSRSSLSLQILFNFLFLSSQRFPRSQSYIRHTCVRFGTLYTRTFLF